jgi:hypothetical protein
VKFKMASGAHEFAVRLHFKTRELCKAFEKFSEQAGLPEPVITSISRDPDFYEDEGLPTKKFSWHYVNCAADLRVKHYSPTQLALVIGWFSEKCRSSEWELDHENHGTGPHVHVAYREFGLRRDWEKEQFDKKRSKP